MASSPKGLVGAYLHGHSFACTWKDFTASLEWVRKDFTASLEWVRNPVPTLSKSGWTLTHQRSGEEEEQSDS